MPWGSLSSPSILRQLNVHTSQWFSWNSELFLDFTPLLDHHRTSICPIWPFLLQQCSHHLLPILCTSYIWLLHSPDTRWALGYSTSQPLLNCSFWSSKYWCYLWIAPLEAQSLTDTSGTLPEGFLYRNHSSEANCRLIPQYKLRREQFLDGRVVLLQ